MNRSRLLPLSFAFLFFATFAFLEVRPAAADNWTSLSGASTVSGEMIGLWNGRVLLVLDGGRRVAVRMEDLRADSRIQAEKRYEELQQRLQERKQELSAIAEESVAPAPKEAGNPPPAPEYQSPPPGESLEESIAASQEQLAAGHIRVFYDMTPESHRKLIDELAVSALKKIEPQSFETVRSTIHDIAEVVVMRQRWVFSHPRLAQTPEEIRTAVVSAAELLRAATAEEVMSIERLTSQPFDESVAALSDALAPYVYRTARELSAAGPGFTPDIEVSPGSDTTMIATVNIPMFGPVSTTYTQVEGRWVEGENPKESLEKFEQWLAAIQEIPDGSLSLPAEVQAILNPIRAAASGLQTASSKAEFHRQIDEMLPTAAGFFSSLAESAVFQPPGAQAGRNASQNGYSENEYEEPMYEDEYMPEP